MTQKTPKQTQGHTDTPHVSRSVCPLSVTTEGEGSDRRVVRVTGDADHPVTRGAICHKVQRFPERTHSDDRLLYPLRRIKAKNQLLGRPSADEFERISWDEAYTEIARRFRDISQTHGAEAILPYSFYGNMGVLNSQAIDRRFFHKL